jgi:hypothetical protein
LAEVAEPQAWTLKGVGMYGSDVEVVSLDAYRRLAQRCENAEAAALMWGRKCIELEGRAPSDFDDARLLDIVRALRLPYSALREALERDRGASGRPMPRGQSE